jgi:hypothetical protein
MPKPQIVFSLFPLKLYPSIEPDLLGQRNMEFA